MNYYNLLAILCGIMFPDSGMIPGGVTVKISSFATSAVGRNHPSRLTTERAKITHEASLNDDNAGLAATVIASIKITYTTQSGKCYPDAPFGSWLHQRPECSVRILDDLDGHSPL